MKKRILLTFVTLFCAFSAVADVFIVSQDTSVAERTAARRLAYYLKQMLNENVKVTKKAVSPAIYIGKNPQTAKMLGLKDFSSLKFEEVIIKSVGKDLVILGEGNRGTLYAMYTYLEDFLGFRFWAMNEYDVPDKKNFKMSGIDYRYNPVFVRRAMNHWPFVSLPAQWKSGTPEYAAIFRLNSSLTLTDDRYGNGNYAAGFCHTFRRILPHRKYFKTHPGYYSLIEGKRHNDAQLCLSNKEMRKVFIEEAKKYYVKQKGNKAIVIAHDDNGLFCQCQPCQELLKREKGRMSGVELDFVNEVAAELEKTYPGIQVVNYAYGPTIKAPLVTMPRKNVIICHASTAVNAGYPLTHEANQKIKQTFMDWAKVSDKMGVWFYTGNAKNDFLAQPALNTYAENIKFARDNKVIDIFIDNSSSISMGLSHMNVFQGYIVSRMLWNPYLDYNKLVKDFTDGYYGKKAGALIRDYIDQIHEPLKHKIPASLVLERIKKGYLTEYYLHNIAEIKKDPSAMIYPPIAVYMDHVLGFMSRENMIKCFRLMEKALAEAENETFKERVRDAAFNIRVALLTDYDIAADPEKYGFTAAGLKELVKVTFADARRIGNRRMGLKNSGITVIENQISRIHELNKKVIPDFLKGVNSKTLEFFNYKDWSLMVPNRAVIIDDPESFDGKAYSMINTPPSWALQCRNITTSVRPGKYKMYLRMRMVPKKGVADIRPGNFFNGGYYWRKRNKKSSYSKKVFNAKTEEFKDGKYHWKYAGTHEVNTESSAFFFLDPCNHPDVEAIVVDQLLLQRVGN